MTDYDVLLKYANKTVLFALAAGFMGWAVFPEYKPYFAGFLLGTAASILNAQHLAWKVNRAAEKAARQEGRRVNLGFITRASMSLLAVVIALKFEAYFSVVTTIIGLIFFQLATLILGILSLLFFRKSP